MLEFDHNEGMEEAGTASPKRHFLSPRAGPVIGALLLVFATDSALAWTPQALPPLPGDDMSVANDVNDKNFVAGRSTHFVTSEVITTAVVWNELGVPRALRTPRGFISCNARAINRHGYVTGFCFGGVDAAPQRAVRWNPRGAPTILPPLKGNNQSTGEDINDLGTVVGDSFDGVDHKATIWGGRTPRLLPDGHLRVADGINNLFVIIGRRASFEPVAWPNFFRPPQPLEPMPNGDAVAASAINNLNRIVGRNDAGSDAIIWMGLKSDPRALRNLPDATGAQAFGINDRNEVVGVSGGPESNVATFWDRKGVPTALPPLPGGHRAVATAIGERGIAGTSFEGSLQDPSMTAVLWRR